MQNTTPGRKSNTEAEKIGQSLTIIDNPPENKDETRIRKSAKEKYQEEVCIEQGICDWIDGEKVPPLAQFKGDFYIYRPDDREDELFEKRDNIFVPCLPKVISGRATRQLAAYGEGFYNRKYSDIRTILNRWMDWTENKRLKAYPQPVGFKSSEWDCFNRLDWDPIPCTFEEMEKECSRVIAPTRHRILTNRDALDIRMGSLSDVDSDRKQAIYLWGEYDAGKSFLFNEILFKLAGGLTGVLSIRPRQTQSPHWEHALLRKTVLIINECPPSFIDDDEFKALTGDNLIMVNPKNKTIYGADIRCLIFMASNKPPEISGDPALKRRVIDCEIMAMTAQEKLPLPVLREALKHELKFYMGYCIEKYKEFKATGAVEIPTDKTGLEGHIENHESRMDAIFHRHFNYVPDLPKPTLTLGEFQEIVKLDLFQSKISSDVMRDFVARKYHAHTSLTFWHKSAKKNLKGLAYITIK